MLGLFREHVFQPMGDGASVLDFGHVVECLNKLDLGTDERVALLSRDHGTVLVASYKELKIASEATFKQLLRKVTSAPSSSLVVPSAHPSVPAYVPRSTRPYSSTS